MIRSAIVILLCSFAYTLLRYVVLGPVTSDQIPAFLLNKAVSIASVVYLFVAARAHAQGHVDRVRFYGMAALQAAYIHLVLSLALFSAVYFPDLYEAGKMNVRGQLAVASGVLGAYGFWLIRRNLSVDTVKRALQILSALAITGHLVAIGSGGWPDTDAWHGSLPPISLIGFLLALISSLLLLRSTPAGSGE